MTFWCRILAIAGRSVVLTVLVYAFLTLLPGVAFADNCGSVIDCFFNVEGGIAALLATAFSMGLDFVPIVGDVKGVIEGLTGRDLITGQKLEPWERALGLVGLSELRHAGRAVRFAGQLDNLGDLGRAGSDWARANRRWATETGQAAGERWSRAPGHRGRQGVPTAPSTRWQDHIREGHHRPNGTVTGGHHRPSMQSVPNTTVTPRGAPDRHGVYEAQWTRTHPQTGNTPNPKTSTMFPDSWSPQRVQDEVSEAFSRSTPTNHPSGRQWTGVSSSGVRIQGWVDTNGNITSAYPQRLPDWVPPPPYTTGVAARAISNISEGIRMAVGDGGVTTAGGDGTIAPGTSGGAPLGHTP